MADDDGFHFTLDYEQQLPAMDPLSPETQCQFILKRNEKMTNRIPTGRMKQGVICKTANGKGLSQRVTAASSLTCLPSYFPLFSFTFSFVFISFMYDNLLARY